MKEIIDKLIEEDGWALYARIGMEMKNKFADFVPKNYNCRSMKELIGKVIGSIGNYEIKTGKDGTTMFLLPASERDKTKASAQNRYSVDEGYLEREKSAYKLSGSTKSKKAASSKNGGKQKTSEKRTSTKKNKKSI